MFLGLAAPQTRPGDAIAPDRQVISLFNGKDLSGFHTWLVDSGRKDPRMVFTVRDGMIRISGDGFGYLSTDRSYRDYHLVVEFKWGEGNLRGREKHARDSGLFLHSAGPDGNSFDGNGAFKAAIECQIMEGAVGDILLINGKALDGKRIPVRFRADVSEEKDADGYPWWRENGKPLLYDRLGRLNWQHKDPQWRDVLDFRGKRDVESRPGEWTRLECICAGDTIIIRVNGQTVNQIRNVHPTSGPILLQCEGSEIFFRHLELHPLSP